MNKKIKYLFKDILPFKIMLFLSHRYDSACSVIYQRGKQVEQRRKKFCINFTIHAKFSTINIWRKSMLKKVIPVVFALSFTFLAPTFTYANSPQPGPSVLNAATPAGSAFPKGVIGTVINYVHANKDRVWENGSSYRAKNKSTFNLVALKPRYGLGNGWDIRASIPIIANDFSKAPSRNGVGDSVVVLRKQIVSQENSFPVSIALGGGIMIPTGSTSYNGLGAGAWGLYGEMGITYAFDAGRQLIEGAIGYIYMGDGKAESPTGIKIDDIDQNDIIRVQARYAIAINKNWDFGIEAQYEHVLESSVSGRGRDDTATTLFAGPSIRYKMPQWKASIGLSPQFAIYNDFEAANKPGKGSGPAAETFRIEAQLQKAF